MKNLKILFCVCIFVLLATMLGACKSTSIVPPTTTETTSTKTITEVIRDTVFTTKKDSSYYKAYLECVNGKVVIKNEKATRTKGSHLNSPKVNLKDNVLQVDCIAEAQKLFATWKDKFTLEHKSSIQKIPYPVEKQLTWWQKTQMILGNIFLVIIGLFLAVVILRLTKVIKV